MDVIEWWNSVKASYEESVYRNGDKRVENWIFVHSPWPTITLCLSYLLMCTVGPKLMAQREPFNLKPLLVIYNFLMVCLSFYIFMELIICARLLGYNFICDKLVYKDDPTHMRLAAAIWLFYFSKFIEFLDTLFFILRKKNSQISFLHIYHHTSMLFIWWIAVKWYAGGTSFFSPMLNCVVHTFMYTYYALSVFPSLRKYLWWKRYLTILQLSQFLLVIVVCVYNLYTACDFDKRVLWSAVIYLTSQFLLFLNFYLKSYSKSNKKKTDSNANNFIKSGDFDNQKQD